MSGSARVSGPKIYRFKIRGTNSDFWTEWYRAMSYADARMQMRNSGILGKLLDYEMENTHG